MLEIIKEFTSAFGVSGNEEEIADLILSKIDGKVDVIKKDVLGNILAIKKGKGKRLLLSAHMDQLGVLVTHIDQNGYIKFSAIGGLNPHKLFGKRVRFKNGIIGIVETIKDHKSIKDLTADDLFIDIGALTRIDAEKHVKIGDVATFADEPIVRDNLIISKALDDRIGCAILVKLIQNLVETENEIYFGFTVQEEIGCFGAKTIINEIEPDYVIAVDVVRCSDKPGVNPEDSLKIGGGPCIIIKDRRMICNPEVRNILELKAKETGIPYQYEFIKTGGVEASAIFNVKGGYKAGCIAIPVRYVHSSSEMALLEDIENTYKLLYSVCK